LIAPSIDDLERAHDAVKYGEASSSPWLEISVPSANDDGLAPAGQHVMSIYAHHAPSGTTADVIYERAWNVLRAYAPNLESTVVEQEVITADDLEAQWGMTGGHIFHGEGALDQWWVSRPLLGWAHHYASPIGGLFLAGAGSHPGGGLTGQTGLNAARVISDALGRRRR
jgi:phytoene dehydrogenase-like protein